MALFVIADLHLSLDKKGKEKPMDIFPGWERHAQRLEKAWNELVKPEDVVVVPGDLSWGMSMEEATEDFRFVHNLPGKKVILKGNHDYYWNTMKKMTEFLNEHSFGSISILHNNAFLYENVWLCGSRGWMAENADAFNKKIIEREAQRLQCSLSAAKEGEKLVFLHYPPFDKDGKPIPQLLDVMKREGVRRCYFGHLHGPSVYHAPEGEREGIEFRLISADRLKFTPMQIIID